MWSVRYEIDMVLVFDREKQNKWTKLKRIFRKLVVVVVMGEEEGEEGWN